MLALFAGCPPFLAHDFCVVRQGPTKEEVDALVQVRPTSSAARGVGPREALQRMGLQDQSDIAKQVWLEEARLEAILGSCKLSMPSVRSGIRCYIAFVGTIALFVRSVVALCAWAVFVRCHICRQAAEVLPSFSRLAVGMVSAFSLRGDAIKFSWLH